MSNQRSKIHSVTDVQLDKYQFTILSRIWILDPSESKLLDRNSVIFMTTASEFQNYIEQENYPDSYQDTFKINHFRYNISYIFCSGQYLEDLAQDKPRTELVFKLRVNYRSNFAYCIVRPWEKTWTLEHLLKQGAVRFVDKST